MNVVHNNLPLRLSLCLSRRVHPIVCHVSWFVLKFLPVYLLRCASRFTFCLLLFFVSFMGGNLNGYEETYGTNPVKIDQIE